MDFFWERGTRPASASCSGYTTRNATKRTAFPLAECLQATSEVRTASCWLRDGPFLLFYLAIESVVEKAGCAAAALNQSDSHGISLSSRVPKPAAVWTIVSGAGHL